jgi:hypothetical protein
MEAQRNHDGRIDRCGIPVRKSRHVQSDERPAQVDQKAGTQSESYDVGIHSPGHSARDGFRRQAENRLIWEKPLGTIRGPLDEPGPRFVDVEGEADKAACIWERDQSTLGKG